MVNSPIISNLRRWYYCRHENKIRRILFTQCQNIPVNDALSNPKVYFDFVFEFN